MKYLNFLDAESNSLSNPGNSGGLCHAPLLTVLCSSPEGFGPSRFRIRRHIAPGTPLCHRRRIISRPAMLLRPENLRMACPAWQVRKGLPKRKPPRLRLGGFYQITGLLWRIGAETGPNQKSFSIAT